MVKKMMQKTIKKGVNSKITFNIIDIDNPKEIWDIWKKIWLEIGQEVVYLVLQEIMNYPCIDK